MKIMKIDKEKILIFSIVTPMMFAALTVFGFVGSLITLGKAFFCNLNVSVLSYFLGCGFMYETIEGNQWFLWMMLFLGKLFIWATLPITIIGYTFFLIAGFYFSKKK